MEEHGRSIRFDTQTEDRNDIALNPTLLPSENSRMLDLLCGPNHLHIPDWEPMVLAPAKKLGLTQGLGLGLGYNCCRNEFSYCIQLFVSLPSESS